MESVSVLDQLGINWKLLLSQVVNFFILLIILRAFVYKPLLKAIKNRNDKIREGLAKANEADIRLREVDEIAKHRLQKASHESMMIIKSTEEKAKQLEKLLSQKAQDYQKELMEKIEQDYQHQQEEVKNRVLDEAINLVKTTLVKTVELNPKEIDEALIKKAIWEIGKNS